MSVCACGRITSAGQSACDRCIALSLFGLTRDATQTQIKDAYRVLAKVWHPDRFHNDDQLRAKAEQKLKEVNSAYQLLTTTVSESPGTRPSRPAPRAEEPQRASTAASATGPHWPPRPNRFNSSFQTKQRANNKRLVITVAILIAGGFAIYWFARMANPLTDNSHPQTAGSAAVETGAAGQASKPSREVNGSNRVAAKAGAQNRSSAASSRASVVVYPSDDPLVPYFTVGSTRDDVVRVQGAPDKATSDVFTYGMSKVYFRNGRVESWRTDPASPLKARMPL